MAGHQRNLDLYDRYNARVVGVSRDEVTTLKYWADELGLTFPVLSNTTGHFGTTFGAQPPGSPMFSRRTVIIDKKGEIRYMRDGSPDYHEVLTKLKELNVEEAGL